MDPILQVGKGGITESVVTQTDEALEARELIKCRVLVDSARSWRAEAIENCRFTMIQVWQAEHSATGHLDT